MPVGTAARGIRISAVSIEPRKNTDVSRSSNEGGRSLMSYAAER